MIVTVTHCWCGNNKYTWRLEPPLNSAGFKRCVLRDADANGNPVLGWDRDTAKRALDLLEVEWGVKRSSVRFRHT